MACYHPLTAYRSKTGRDPVTGKWPIVFNISQGYSDMPVLLPCGQCIGCRLERSRQWAIRCVHESSLYDDNCFLTLTYDDEHLPYGRYFDLESGEIIDNAQPSLNKRDIVLFLKRLRKRFGDGIRFFQCGEYGDKYGRPHHHVLLFNFDFPDKKLWQVRDGIRLYRSKALEELWPYGISSVGELTFESAAYVARYVTKKITGDCSDEHYRGREPEYVTMSRRPGIARGWFDRFSSDVYTDDNCVVRPGLIARPPKYYDNLYDLKDSEKMRRIRVSRRLKAESSGDNTYERRLVKEKIQYRKFEKLVRPYEKEEIL